MNGRTMLTTALLTGVFCVGFSVFIGILTEALGFLQVLLASFVSGFLGSLFGQSVTARRDAR